MVPVKLFYFKGLQKEIQELIDEDEIGGFDELMKFRELRSASSAGEAREKCNCEII